MAPLIIATSLAMAAPEPTPAATQTIVDERGGGEAGAVNRLVGGIISFVRWPDRQSRAPLAICSVGRPAFTNNVRPVIPGTGPAPTYAVVSVAAVTEGQACDIIYIGSLGDADRRRLIQWVGGKAVLTVTDVDPQCQLGAAICLFRRGGGIAFSLNMDAVARSRLRVDPRVLQLGRAAT